jgi:uncharacterized protein (TIGR02001 family)
MKKVLGVLLLMATGYASAAEVSGNVTLASDYRFRGISQLEGDISPAIQGGFDVAFDNGIYLGTWASNVNFTGSAIELDGYGGWSGDITDGINLDLGFLYYAYPKDSDLDADYYEFYGKLTWVGITFGVAYSPDYFAETGKFGYFSGDYSWAFAENFSLDLHVGYNLFEDSDEFGNGTFLSDDEDAYVDYSIGVSTSYFDLDWSAAFIGTSLDDEDYFDASDLIDETIVLSVSKSL